MIRFLITYDAPPDPAAFERHYREVHQPLTAHRPGILEYTVHRSPRTIRGPAYHQVVELTWPDWDAVERAFASPQGRAAAADMANLHAPTRSCLYQVPEAPSR